MGCCQHLSNKEKIIIAKEQRLNFNKLTAHQIKNAFPFNEEGEELNFAKFFEGLARLNIIYSESEKTTIIKPFLSSFLKESIMFENNEEVLDQRNLLTILYILSKSSDYDKACHIFELFDVGKNDSMTISEFKYLMNKIFSLVDSYSETFFYSFYSNLSNIEIVDSDTFLKKKEIENLKLKRNDNIINELITYVFTLENNNSLNREKFYQKFKHAWAHLSINFLQSSQIRITLEKYGEKVDLNMKISNFYRALNHSDGSSSLNIKINITDGAIDNNKL